jgi:hyaluronate lyase
MAGQTLATDPVPVDQVPGAGVVGTVIVDDGDPSVVRVPAGKSEKFLPPPEHSPVFGDTGLVYNKYNAEGDGKTTITVSPALSAGRYAVWVRFVRLARNSNGSASKAVIQLHDKTGVWDYTTSPQQGGQWVLLGVHELSGSGVVLSLCNTNMRGVACFDAAVFVPAGPAAPRAPRYLPPPGDGFATIIRRAADQAIGPTETPPADPVVAQRLRARDFEARLAWDTLIRGGDTNHLWGDGLTGESFRLSREAGRLRAMAAAWAGASEIDGMHLRGNPKLLADTLAALDTFLSHRWTPTTKWDVNWWDFEIGVPERIMEALCVLGPNVTPDLKAKAFASMAHFTVDPWFMYNKAVNASGANRIWMVQQHIRRAALAGDAKGLERCRDGLPSVMAFVDQDPGKKAKNRDGWWRDGSFIQHGYLPYVGAYGCLLIPDLIDCIGLLEGTPWELKTPERDNMSQWVGDHLLPVAYEGELFPRTTGRTAGSMGIETASQWLAIALCEMRASLSTEQAAQITATLRRWFESGSLDPKLERANFSQFLNLHAIATDKTLKPAGPYIASRTHAAVDLAVHHRPGWAASVAMSSTRIVSHEAYWGNNYRGWSQGEGVLMLYPGDPQRYRHGFWALVDPYRLPGITTSTWSLPDHDGGGGSSGKPSKQDFVGGASLDDVASVAAMRVGREGTTLSARKGWFLFPDAVVCLGSGITSTNGTPCETIVENCRIEKLDLPFAVDGKPVPAGVWEGDLAGIRTLHLGGMTPERAIGWWFPPSSMRLTGERCERTGCWKNAGKNGSEAPITQPWLSLILGHGVDPRDATYQYAILPGVSAERLKDFAAKPTIEILACTPQVQAVRDTANSIEGFIFFEPGTAGSITVDQPCVVVLHESRDGLSLAVADPTQKLAALSLTLTLKPTGKMTTDTGVTVGTGTPLRIDFNLTNALGCARTVRWNK